MTVWKRNWKTRSGEDRQAWVFEYRDGNGRRHLKTFKLKKDAEAAQAKIKVDVGAGTHVEATKVTVAEAAEQWIESGKGLGLERATIEQYHQHVYQHIVPLIGTLKLSKLTVPVVRNFEDRLRDGRSPTMVRKVMASLSSILADAQERGLVARNVAHDLRRNRRRGKEHHAEKRRKPKLKVGVDIPTPDEIKAIIHSTSGRWRPLLITAIFTGLRASELRGLRWKDVDLKKQELHVRQRADRYNEIGRPKSEAGERTVPLPKFVTNTLKEWKLKCPKGELLLVFPNGAGNIENLGNIINRGLIPAQVAGGVVDEDGKAKYTGMHSLRHFFASWCINRTKDGGLGLPPKNVQERLGHSSITMTLDTYGHLFKSDDDGELDLAADALVAVH